MVSLIIDVGPEDFLTYQSSITNSRLLVKTPIEYTERPGAHTWQYWTEACLFTLHFIISTSNVKKNPKFKLHLLSLNCFLQILLILTKSQSIPQAIMRHEQMLAMSFKS